MSASVRKLWLVVALLGLAACSNAKTSQMSQLFSAETAEPSAGEQSSAVLSPVDGYLIGINKSVLDQSQNFLLSGSVIPQLQAPTSTGLLGKVVRFQRYGDEVGMYESTQGLVVTDDLPAQLLLAKFQIVREDDDKVVIDFDKGLQRLFVAQWWMVTDNFNNNSVTAGADVVSSQVFALKFNEDKNRLTIRQSVQAKVKGMFASESLELYEMRYYLQPYEINKSFEPKENNGDLKNVGYFNSAAKLKQGSGVTTRYALRFDLNKPIKFYYSANTPKDYQQAVKDGILYWNKAYGKEVVTAAEAPAGVVSPDPDYNIVQWVPWDSAGFAYADIIADPLTGESLHGQVYLTSVFAIKSIERARRALRVLEAEGLKDTKSLGLSFLSSARRCSYHSMTFMQSFKRELAELLQTPNLTNAAVLRYSQDYVREVVAHEIGHVLGLRHNFAGSLQPNVNLKESYDWFQKYLTSEEPVAAEDKYLVTSVMDYSVPVAAVMAGARIREGGDALPYDEAAIAWGYYEKEMPEDMLFCTDDHLAGYWDCNQFDAGPVDLESNKVELERSIKAIPANFIEQFISAKTDPNLAARKPVEEVDPQLRNVIAGLLEVVNHSLKRFDDKFRSIAVERTFPFVSEFNQDEVRKKRWDRLKEELAEFDNKVWSLFFSFLPTNPHQGNGKSDAPSFDAETFLASVKKQLESAVYEDFVGLDGEVAQFTQQEQEVILDRAERYFTMLQNKFLIAYMKLLTTHKYDLAFEALGIEEDPIIEKLQDSVAKVAKHIVLKTNPEKTLQGKLSSASRAPTVLVQDFYYDLEVRQVAAGLLGAKIGGYRDWAANHKKSLSGALKSYVDQSLMIQDVKSFDDKKLSRTLRHWYKQQKSVMAKVGVVPTTTKPVLSLKLGATDEQVTTDVE